MAGFVDLHQSGLIEQALQRMEQNGHLYKEQGATWFRSTAFGDDKDRVVQRDNGLYTYFAADIAYHFEKYQRGYNHLINVWGADHHGYIVRVQAALQAMNLDPKKLSINLVQFANLLEDGKKVSMSTRSGTFVTLRELREKVGNDAARFFYVQRQADQHMDFDISLALSEDKDNPVYYIQYAHARVNSVLEQVGELPNLANVNFKRLTESKEQSLLCKLADYPDIVEMAAKKHQPHQLTTYLYELAASYHSYYNETRINIDDTDLKFARAYLSKALQQVIGNGLSLLNVSAPERM